MLAAQLRSTQGLNPNSILAMGRDLIAGSTRTFVRASSRYGAIGNILAIDQPDANPSVEIFPGCFAHGYSMIQSFTRANDRNPAGNFASNGTFVVDGVEPSKYTWSQTAPAGTVFFAHRLTISNNAAYNYQLCVVKNNTGRVRFRVQDSTNTDSASIDFDLVTGTMINPLFTGNGGNHAFSQTNIIDCGTYWAVMLRWRAVSADGTTGSNGQMQIYLTDDAGSTTGAAIPSQVISFVQIGQNIGFPPYVIGAGLAVANAADSLTLDPLPINFLGAGEIWAFNAPLRWGGPIYGQAGGSNPYCCGWAPLDPPSTEPWRTYGMNVTTASGGQVDGGGNIGRGNGGGATPASVSAYSGANPNYWMDGKRQYLGGGWNKMQDMITFDSLAVVGNAITIKANLPALAQPPRTFNRLNIYPYGSANVCQGRMTVWGWNRLLSPAERRCLSRALNRTQYLTQYP